MRYPNLPLELFNRSKEPGGRTRLVHHKKDGAWRKFDHDEAVASAERIAFALKALGCERGHRIGVISRTRMEWMLADLGIMAGGMITIGIYETSTPEQCAYILNHSEAGLCFVEDASQALKVAGIAGDVPSLKTLVVFSGEPPAAGASGLSIIKFDDFLNLGTAGKNADPGWLDRTMASIRPDDTAIIVYTSGTTGEPKGVVLSHRTVLAVLEATRQVVSMVPGDLGLSFLPMAHILQRTSSYLGISVGVDGAYAESIDRFMENMRELKPTTMSAVPRVFEKAHARIMAEVSKASPAGRAIFNWALDAGFKRSALLLDGKTVPFGLAARCRIADRLVFKKIRAAFGGRIRLVACGGAPLSVDLIRFFDAMGLTILEGYGLTETASQCALNLPEPGKRRFGTVGRPLPGVDVKIADDGEICVRGPSVFREYYRNPEATREAFDGEGYFKTGDIGLLDADGFLKITDRKKDLIITAAGKNVAPQPIENALKTTGYISQAVVVGDRRRYLTALLALDRDEIAAWARRNGLAAADFSALSGSDEVRKFVQGLVDGVNEKLPRYEQIKYFSILPGDLTIESGEITPTMKVKRRRVEERYRDLIEGMYSQPFP